MQRQHHYEMKNISTPVPAEFLSILKADFPEAADRIASALDDAPESSVRFARGKGGKHPAWMEGAEKIAWADNGYYLPERPNFTLTPQWHAGQFYPQDASSMIIGTIAASLPVKPKSVLDLCAAPGGKTTALLDAIEDDDVVFVANEYDRRRAQILRENLIRYGDQRVVAVNLPADALVSSGLTFDFILVDAPCSGEGMMRKEEVARRQWSPSLISQCAALQREILTEAVKMLKPGGYLIYSTCTLNRSENEDNVDFACRELGLEAIDTGLAEKFGIHPSLNPSLPALRFIPGITRGEGLFVALMRKSEDEAVRATKTRKQKQKKTPATVALPEWVSGKRLTGIAIEDSVIAMPEGLLPIYYSLKNITNPLLAGVEVARMKGRKTVVTHPVLMSRIFLRGSLPEVEVDKEDALRYLRHQTLVLPADTPRGITVLTFEGLPLGAVNNLGNRANNLYPQEFKIKWL